MQNGQRDFLRFQANASPHKIAVRDLAAGRDWTYEELDADVQRCVAVLNAMDVGAADRIAVLSTNNAHLLVVHFACTRIGAIFVPLNWRLAARELEAQIEDASPVLLIHEQSFAARAQCPHLTLDALREKIDSGVPASNGLIDPEAISILLYTSGTTGRSKGAMLSERNVNATGQDFATVAQVDRSSVFLCETPLFHGIGLIAAVRSTLVRGATLILSDGFEAERTLAYLMDPSLGVTHYFCVPQMAAALRSHPNFDAGQLSNMIAIFTGGAPLTMADVQPWIDVGIPIVNGYGMTETGTLTGMPVSLDAIRLRPSSVGQVPPTQSVRIVDDLGDDMAVGQAGEIWIKGPNLSSGYWERPEENAASFVPGGWFRTGDIGQFDADGFLTIIGRKKDMYISGGENVYLAEVEAALSEHADVVEVALLGVADARWGEVGHAFLVLREGAVISQAEIDAHCAERLARFKMPKSFEIVDALPRTTTGKVNRAALRDAFVPNGKTGQEGQR